MARWLTLEAAAQAVAAEQKQLEEYLTDKSPEAQFQAHGLLFDRQRWQAGKEFLQLLEQPVSSSASAATPQTLPLSSEKERSYRWHETPIRLQIAWLPVTYSPSRLTAEDGASNLTVKNFLSRRVLSRCSMSDLHPR
jgi:hypothetical protein